MGFYYFPPPPFLATLITFLWYDVVAGGGCRIGGAARSPSTGDNPFPPRRLSRNIRRFLVVRCYSFPKGSGGDSPSSAFWNFSPPLLSMYLCQEDTYLIDYVLYCSQHFLLEPQ